MLKTKDILPILAKTFPPLNSSSKKGENGRVAVIGGSFQFTGAPYYAAISSLKVGGDLAHIFCAKSAATAIKAYSPEIIVHPVFASSSEVKLNEDQLKNAHDEWLEEILKWKPAINSWVIGPGMGRDKYLQAFFPLLVKNLPQGNVVVFDADGIHFLCKNPDLFPILRKFKTFITPNHNQLSKLKSVIELDIENLAEKYKSEEQIEEIESLQKLTDFSLFIKGKQDLILTNKKSFIVRTEGGLKRCGGIGDIVSGSVAVCSFWNQQYGLILASRIVKMAARLAFEKEGRSLTAPSVINQLPEVIMKLEKPNL